MPRKLITLLIGFFVLTLLAPHLYSAESMLSWDAVTGDVTGYKIYYGTSSGSYFYSKDAGNVTQYPLANLFLEEGTTYYFVVRAYNASGESESSNETSYAVPSPGDTTPPLAPQGLTSGVSNLNITLNWQANAEPDLAGYKVYYGNSSRSYGPSIPTGHVTSYTIDNLEAGKTYYLAVVALDSAGNESGYSTEAVETIPTAPGGAPPAEEAKLQWDAVTGDVIGYKVYYGTSSGSYSNSFDVGNVTQCALSDLPLTDKTTYYFIVRAYSDAGESDNSNETSYTTGAPGDAIPPLEVGHADYCRDYGPCTAGQGDCDSDSECQSGLVCNQGVGSNYGWALDIDVCEPPPAGTGQVGNANYCRDYGPCAAGQGDCDSDNECQSGLVCNQDVGFKYGFRSAIDVCEGQRDTTVPAVTITGPTSGDTYETSSSTVDLSGSASDNVGVTQVLWNNDRGGSDVASGTTSWSITDVDLAEGANMINVTATDTAGKQSTDTLTVTYTPPDTVDPAVSITAPTSDSTYTANSSPINVSGDASDDVDISQVTWVNDRGGSGTASGTTSWWISNIQLSEGDNVLTVTATDTSGNQSTDTLSVTYTPLDTIDPSVSITEPTSGSTYTTTSSLVNLSGNALDNVGINQVTWVNDRGGSGTASGTTSWSASNLQLLEGDNVLTVTAKDAAGNQSTDVLTVSFTPGDSTAPVITIKSPTTRTKYRTKSSAINLSGSASDNVGVSQVTWTNSLGGSGMASGTSSWSISNIPLSKGTNVLTVTATDAAGNQSTDTLKVTKR
jgi:fibronectin type 3 domain-containing protein